MGKRQSVPLLMALPRAQDARVVVKAAKHATLAIVAVSPKRNAHANPAIVAVNPKRNAPVRRSPPAPSVNSLLLLLTAYDTRKRWEPIASIYSSLTTPPHSIPTPRGLHRYSCSSAHPLASWVHTSPRPIPFRSHDSVL